MNQRDFIIFFLKNNFGERVNIQIQYRWQKFIDLLKHNSAIPFMRKKKYLDFYSNSFSEHVNLCQFFSNFTCLRKEMKVKLKSCSSQQGKNLRNKQLLCK